MQTITLISISNGQPVICGPLFVIVIITAIKDFMEDLKRKRSDNEENNRAVQTLRYGILAFTTWSNLRVGEVIKVNFIFFLFDF